MPLEKLKQFANKLKLFKLAPFNFGTKLSQFNLKIKELDTPAAGTWSRDCELIRLSDYEGFKITYIKSEDETYWKLCCSLIVAYKLYSEEFSKVGYLINLPVEGAFYEIIDSPWIKEFGKERAHILDKCKHYVLQFYDETVEIIAQEFTFRQLDERPKYYNE